MTNKSLFTFVALFIAICAYLLFDSNKKLINLEYIKDNIPTIGSFLAWVTSSHKNVSPDFKMFTVEELKSYIGENNGEIYLSILGKVFDVTKGRKYYEKGESYHGFAGRDASKAFVTGDFSSSGLTDDISELTINEIGDLYDWLQMYEKDYIYKGRLIGRFYSSDGEPTAFLKSIHKQLGQLNKEKSQMDEYKKRFPPCNVEWTQESGSRVWCTKQSGGVKRNWIGVPRKLYQPGASEFRCACVNPSEKMSIGKVMLYENCKPDSVSCFVKT